MAQQSILDRLAAIEQAHQTDLKAVQQRVDELVRSIGEIVGVIGVNPTPQPEQPPAPPVESAPVVPQQPL